MRLKGRQLWSGLVVGLATAVITTMAVLYQGYTTAQVDLNDGGVWVTRTQDAMVGHLNYPSLMLDAATKAKSPEFELYQDGNDVITFDSGAGTLAQLDPARVGFLTGDGSLAAGSRVAFHHGVLALIDAAANGLYVITPSTIPGFSVAGRDPLVSLGAGSVVAVSTAGTVFAASAENSELVTVQGEFGTPVTKSLQKFGEKATLQITAVGETAVLLDSTNAVLYTPERVIAVPEAKDGRLQAAGAANDKVAIATASGLVEQPLDGSKPTVVPVTAGGTPAEPVWLNGCTYAVWSGTAAYVRDCANDADDMHKAIPGAGSQPRLTLRQNRNVVVINELGSGMVWLPDQDLTMVNNWDQFLAKNNPKGDEDQSDKIINQFTLPKRDGPNHKPKAVDDDHFGVRAGSTAILPVLNNDTDPDGDLLEASLVGEPPQFVTVQPSNSGAGLQVTAGRNASGRVQFRYRVDDGRPNGTDEATVTLNIGSAGQNSAPIQLNQRTVRLEVGATVTLDVLADWIDPDGDDLYLKQASDDGDDITARSNGVIQFTEATGERGVRDVNLVVSDGTNDAKGVLHVDVRAKGTLPPVANADRYSATAGETITIAPIANDMSASGKELRLAKIDQVAGTKTTPDFTNNTFSFSAAAAGTYYVQYLVTDGPRAADGIVRIDVHAEDAEGLRPVATKDTALLTSGSQALVDVLANDSDPTGGILVVQSVTIPSGSKVSAEVLEHHIVRVTDTGGLSAPTTIGYRVSNGSQWADGAITVLPVPLPDKPQPPVAVNDRATVRAGDVVTIDVTANDYSPDGNPFELLSQLRETPDPADGYAWVSEGKVRFRAGANEKQVSLVYEIAPPGESPTAGYVRIQITAADASSNSSPLPRSVTARTVAGTSVRIPIPLNGIDPDGDSVELVGITSAPKDGRVSVGDSWLTYDAYAGSSGRDSFDYVVRDRLGATATGTVSVGIAPPSNQNQAPYAVRDQVEVRPGRSVSVPVLSNDTDPDGDQVALVAKSLAPPKGVEARVVESRVLVKAPSEPGTYSIGYSIVDTYGSKANGSLQVTVAADAPLQPPIARDDRVQPIQIGAKPTVDVDVLANDEDPDGVAEDLVVATSDPAAVAGAGGVLTITLAKDPQLILYTVTDLDKQATSAVVFVPGTDSLVPTLKKTEPVEIVAGKELRLPLADWVQVRPEHKPRVAEADSVRAAHAGGGPLVADETTLSYTSDKDYYGPDAVSVQVTDGTGPDDPKGNTAYLTIPIQVLPASNQPPKFLDTSVTVSPGEDPADINWRKLSSDPDKGDLEKLTLKIASVPSGFRAEPDGDRLRISADSGAKEGSQAEVKVEVSDGKAAPTAGTVTVSVTSTQRALPVAVDDTIPSAYQGQSTSVDVLRNDSNPFPDTPLVVVGAKLLSGRGKVAVDGSKVVVTPDASFVGTLVASYRIQDATRAADREAEARIRVTVQGRPDQPSRPVVVTVGDRTVVLKWTRPAENGRPITGYAVTSKVKGFTQKCATTTCTLTGLTNDVEYTFTVVATNDVGTSDVSPASAVARPDTRPDTPAPPSLEFGDRSLKVSWKTPHSSGSAVTSFNLEISPAPESGPVQLVNLAGNSYTWDGLKNGTAYQVRVQAVNRAPEPSEFSQYSKPEVPAAPPDAPGRPTSDPASPVGSQAQVSVTWPAVTGDAANGDAVTKYTLTVMRGGSTIKTVETADNSQNVTVDTSTSDLTFQVTATNKAGESKPSPVSAPRRAAVAPDAPKSVTADPGDQKVKLTFVAGDLNGSKGGEITYHYQVNQTGAKGTISSGGTIGGLTNGTKYTFDVWATSSVDGVEPGKKTTSNSATPFGKPIITFDGSDRLDKSVRFRWHVDDNGSKLTSQDPALSGARGEYTKTGLADGESWTLDVSYGNAAGTSTAKWSERANDPPPPPSVGVYRGSYMGPCPVDGPGPCYEVGVETKNFTSAVTCTLDGQYSTSYGANERKIIGGSYRPWRGLNITFTINCGGVSWSGKMP